MKTYIIGHRKPDTDAVVASIALAFLYKQEDCFGYDNPVPVITDPLNPETTYLFNKFEIDTPKLINADEISSKDQIVLVDHNEELQRLSKLNQDQIVEIIDHHKVNINFKNPIHMTVKTWGSTCTIIYSLMQQQNVIPGKKLASLMLASILSDTVGFKSATSTKKDEDMAAELAKIAQITDIETFTLEIFKAKSDISSLTDEEIVKNDFKVFEFDKQTFIDQLETVEQATIIENKKIDLLVAMQAVKIEEEVDLIFVAITDILQVNTKLLILGDEEAKVAIAAFGGEVVDNLLDIGSKMSRKKEIAPAIETAVKENY